MNGDLVKLRCRLNVKILTEGRFALKVNGAFVCQHGKYTPSTASQAA